ncbi:MAG: TonB-dependent receptor [Niabella sp.]
MFKKKNARAGLLLICSLFVLIAGAQNLKQVSGIVNDAGGTPLSNATVQVKGTRISAITDEKGLFIINVPDGSKTLVVTYVGMPAKEITITGDALQVVTMSSGAGTLSDVVVIGYGTTKRANVTTSISSVSEKDIKNLVVTGIDQALQGKAAGVTVTNNSGQPGGGVSVRIRGITTINSNDPLIVIDGVPFTSNQINNIGYDGLGGSAGQVSNSIMSTLNPNDIASVDILKDASAQAIYGSQAANGVILITTKKGKKGDGKISYDFYIGQSQITRKLDLMNLREFATYQNQLTVNDGVSEKVIDSVSEFQNPAVLGVGTDWQDAIFQNAATQNHQLSFSGATDKSNYYFSLGYLDQEGILLGSALNRYSARMSIDNQIKPWAKVGVSANISRSNQKVTLADAAEGTIWWAAILSPLVPVKNNDGTWAGAGTTTSGVYNSNAVNPVASANLRGNRTISNNIYGNVYAEILPLKWLSLRNEVSYALNFNNNDAYQYEATIGTYSQASKLYQSRQNSYYYAVRNYLNANKTINRHAISGTLGHEIQSGYWEQIYGGKGNLVNNIMDLNAGAAYSSYAWTLSGGKSDWAIESFFARGNYTYNNRYALSASLRRDGSSKFAADKRWGYFPAVSAAWTVTNEKFAEKFADLINYLKIRAGYGSVGNQNPPSGAPNPLYNSTVGIWSGVGFGSSTYLSGLANTDVTWESVVSTNVGFDISLLKSTFEISLDLYKKSTKNMLIFSTGPYFLGIGSDWNDLTAPVGNAGKMTNTGLDLSINYNAVNRKDFTWKVTGIFSTFKNELNSLANLTSSLDGKIYYSTYTVTHTQVGHPVGTFWGLKTNGLFRTTDELNNSLPQFDYTVDQTHTWLGDVRFSDINGDNVIDANDYTIIGSPYPKFTYGLTNSFTYKNFDVSLFLQGSYGAKIFNFLRWQTEGEISPYWNQTRSVLYDRYTAENTSGSLPRFTQTNVNNRAMSDRYIEDGSYLRVQNFTLGYRLPEKIALRKLITNARIYMTIQNLYTFTKYSGYDPEIGAFNGSISVQNVDMGHYPNPRTITAGINLEF